MRNVLFWEAIVIAVVSVIVTIGIQLIISKKQTNEIINSLKK